MFAKLLVLIRYWFLIKVQLRNTIRFFKLKFAFSKFDQNVNEVLVNVSYILCSLCLQVCCRVICEHFPECIIISPNITVINEKETDQQ